MIIERGKKPPPLSLCPGIEPGAEDQATNHLNYGIATHRMMVSDLEHSEKEVNFF
jgi:hypothetical protein